MSTTLEKPRELKIALIGNPNTGKSTLFNALAGTQAHVGNFPGCTVEKKSALVRWPGRTVELIDLPGTYSLAPRSLDEMVAVNVLLGRQKDVGNPDAVICIVDASNLERNLYLVSQVLDVGLPTVVVLNMWDVAKSRGTTINEVEISRRLGVPVVTTSAHRRLNIQAIAPAIDQALTQGPPPRPSLFPAEFQAACQTLSQKLAESGQQSLPSFLLERLLLDVGGYLESHIAGSHSRELLAFLQVTREGLNTAGCRIPAVEARVRYGWARETLTGAVTHPAERRDTVSDRIDQWLTHRFFGMLVFCAVMFIVFQAIYNWSGPLMGLCETGQGFVAGLVSQVIPPGALRSLINDGVIAGVGGVLIFLPQIVLLFLFIALLEDCGYMARAAFLMDKLMTRVGLSGKSFVPLMSSFACAIPGVMAARVIENRRDRMVTILVAPLMSCSARLPVYLLLIAAFVPGDIVFLNGWITLQALVLFAASSLGAVVAVPVAWLLKKTLFKGETPPFVMELPGYKWPSPWIVANRVYDRGRSFVMRAGTLIFTTTVLVWAAGYFPGDHTAADAIQAQIEAFEEAHASELEQRDELSEKLATLQEPSTADTALPEEEARSTETLSAKTQPTEIAELETKLAALDEQLEPLNLLVSEENAISSKLLEQSLLGRLGHVVEPVVRPLGWDWKIGVGVIASFPAREVIIATLGTIYSLGTEVGEDDPGLQSALKNSRWPDGSPVYNLPVALSVMVFFALCAQCASTLMVIRRETSSWGWPAFTFTYMTLLAYLGAFVTYRVGMLFM